MIAYAWDHGVPRTFVVITGDRDLAYAVSVLRMRNFRVVVMSPAGTHSDLGAQASAQLDWSKLVLGFHDGVPETTIFPDGPPAPPNPPSAYTQQQPRATTDTPFSSNFRKTGLNGSAQKQAESAFEPELVELRDIPARARRNSVFSSYDPRKFDVFADFGDVFMTPKTQRGSFGLGDGPLFPRPKSRGEEQSSRTDSAPPNMTHFANLPKPTYPHFHETATGVNQSWKGKTRPIIEPESIEPQAPIASSTTMPNSDSVFEPFGETRPPFQTISTLAQPESKTLSTRGSSVSSSPSSRSTSFSIVQHPNASTAPTSAEPLAANADKAVAPAQQASPKAPTIVPSRRSSDTETPALKKTVDVATSKVASEAPQKSEMKPIQTQPPPVVRPSSAASALKLVFCQERLRVPRQGFLSRVPPLDSKSWSTFSATISINSPRVFPSLP
ncbi:hypothetical protein BDZ97DRAFT_160431 [Flammula alnicola]|nr:hypothetical protein BDZ97DRAFT_160431 [Flammula alnicola]